MAGPRAWDEGIGTGVGSIDTEHRLQVSYVNAIEELVRTGRDPALANQTVKQLVDFTNVHFLSEELMMRLYSYPLHDAHKIEHGRLIEQISDIQRRVGSGEQQPVLDMINTLHDWLTKHIKSMDQTFAIWCAKNKINPQ
jgi:hemerythrin-like metal-binding protein